MYILFLTYHTLQFLVKEDQCTLAGEDSPLLVSQAQRWSIEAMLLGPSTRLVGEGQICSVCQEFATYTDKYCKFKVHGFAPPTLTTYLLTSDSVMGKVLASYTLIRNTPHKHGTRTHRKHEHTCSLTQAQTYKQIDK